MKTFLYFCAAILFLCETACSSLDSFLAQGNPAILNKNLVAQIVKGKTTEEETIKILGTPQGKTVDDGVETLVYSYTISNGIGFTSDTTVLTLVFKNKVLVSKKISKTTDSNSF